MKFDFFLLQHICWLHDIAWIFFGLFFIKNAFYECLRFVFSQECMLKCMKFVWIWIFDFVIFEECLYKCMNFDFFFSFISRIYECRKFWNLIFSLNENACLKAWNLIGVLFEEYRMYEFDLEWKYIYFSKRYFFNTYSKSMYKWLTFIQKVCTKDFFFYDFFLLCTNISKICTSCKVKIFVTVFFFQDFNVSNQKFLVIIEFTRYQFLIF